MVSRGLHKTRSWTLHLLIAKPWSCNRARTRIDRFRWMRTGLRCSSFPRCSVSVQTLQPNKAQVPSQQKRIKLGRCEGRKKYRAAIKALEMMKIVDDGRWRHGDAKSETGAWKPVPRTTLVETIYWISTSVQEGFFRTFKSSKDKNISCKLDELVYLRDRGTSVKYAQQGNGSI